MSTFRLDMTMSLDGYVACPQDSVDDPMGVDGAPISGRRTYEHAGRWNGDHHDGVPIFVLTHDVSAERRRAASTT